jgi:hypothetical protein
MGMEVEEMGYRPLAWDSVVLALAIRFNRMRRGVLVYEEGVSGVRVKLRFEKLAPESSGQESDLGHGLGQPRACGRPLVTESTDIKNTKAHKVGVPSRARRY